MKCLRYMHNTSFRALDRSLHLSITLLGFMLNPGCETAPKETPQSKRITELKTTYEKAPEAAKTAASTGNLARGQSPELVYIALGRPNFILTSADGRVTTWTYQNYLPPPPPRAVQEASKREKFRGNFDRQSQIKDPLQDAVGAFQYNMSRQMVPSTDPLDANKEQKRSDQSWADYARYNTNRELAKSIPEAEKVLKILDDKARVEYIDSLKNDRIADPITVKLEVIFIGHQVSDAIVDDSVSAFVTQP